MVTMGTDCKSALSGSGASDNPNLALATMIVSKGKAKPWINKKLFRSLAPSLAKKFVSAIENGIVSPKGRQGILKLTTTEMSKIGGNYTHKIKILGQGGDLRIYGYQLPNGQFVFDKLMGH